MSPWTKNFRSTKEGKSGHSSFRNFTCGEKRGFSTLSMSAARSVWGLPGSNYEHKKETHRPKNG